MAYKVSGSTTEDSTIVIIDQSLWALAATRSGVVGNFDSPALTTGYKLVIGRNSLGNITAFSDITPIIGVAYTAGDMAVIAGGWDGSVTIKNMEYINISDNGFAEEFGDLSENRSNHAGFSNGADSVGIFVAGSVGGNFTETAERVNISSRSDAYNSKSINEKRVNLASTSNSTNQRGVVVGGRGDLVAYITDFSYTLINQGTSYVTMGDLIQGRRNFSATSNGTNDRGLIACGVSDDNIINAIEYINIASSGNGQLFGEGTLARHRVSCVSNGTNERAVIGGGYTSTNTMDYVTISSIGNATDFGDLVKNRMNCAGVSNGVNERGLFIAGYDYVTEYILFNSVDYITISTTGNAQDFGDISTALGFIAGTSDS